MRRKLTKVRGNESPGEARVDKKVAEKVLEDRELLKDGQRDELHSIWDGACCMYSTHTR